MTSCPECWSPDPRATPLTGARDCLSTHLQYVCGTCGRATCVEESPSTGERRWNYPFSDLQEAVLHLRAAEVIAGDEVVLAELLTEDGLPSFRIFATAEHRERFLATHPGKTLVRADLTADRDDAPLLDPVLRRLDASEVDAYLAERAAPAPTG
jgi:hypothetical protein